MATSCRYTAWGSYECADASAASACSSSSTTEEPFFAPLTCPKGGVWIKARSSTCEQRCAEYGAKHNKTTGFSGKTRTVLGGTARLCQCCKV